MIQETKDNIKPLLLWHQFGLTTVEVWQQPVSELHHVTVNLEVFLYMS
jgi:hypothetical protein